MSNQDYNKLLSRWKKQLCIFSDLLNCSFIVVKETTPQNYTAISYSHPKESTILLEANNYASLIIQTIAKNKTFQINDLQKSDNYLYTLEYHNNLKCFYSIPILYNENQIFGCICMYSRDILLSDIHIQQLKNILSLIEEDIDTIDEKLVKVPSVINELQNFVNLHQFINYFPNGIFFYNTELVITDLNDILCKLINSSRETLQGMNMNELVDNSILPALKNSIQGSETLYEGKYTSTTNNLTFYISLKCAPIYNKKNQICGGIGILDDLSQKHQVEAELKKSELRYKDLVEKINDVIFSINTNDICTYVSPIISLLLGYSSEELIGTKLTDIIHINHQNTFIEAIHNVKAGRTIISEIKVKEKEGGYRWIRTSIRAVFNDDGEFTGIHGVAQDIEDTKKAIHSLRRNEEQLRLIATNISDIIYEWNPINDKLIWHGNPTVIDPSLINIKYLKDMLPLIHKDDREKLYRNWKHSINTQSAWKDEFRLITKDDKITYLHGLGIVQKLNNDNYNAFGTLTDITKEKQLLLNLKETNITLKENILKTKSILSATPDVMFILNKKGDVVDFHSNSKDDAMLRNQFFLNRNVKSFLEPEVADSVMQIIEKVLKTNQLIQKKYEITLLDKIRVLEARMVYLDPEHTISIVRDISLREKAEKDLIAAKELAEESDRLKSSFLANMSHEIRTPMNGIIGFAELLKQNTMNPEDRDYYTSVIVKSGHQLLEIINDVLEISKIETGQINLKLELFNVNMLIKSIIDNFIIIAKEHNNTFSVNLDLPDKSAVIYSDPGKVRQIFTNIISNANKFTLNGNIEVGYSFKDNKENSHILFYVKDDGIGIAQDEQKKIFERFAQANENITRLHGGTGLGLAISKSLTELLGGTIWVESELNKGSSFYFSIPFEKTVVE